MGTITQQASSAPQTGTESPGPTLPEQASALLGSVAGYMASRIIDMGQRAGLIAALAEHPGASTLDLAETLDLDEFFVSVWCRGALGAGVLERRGDGFDLAPHMATLLLDTNSPAFVGGMFPMIGRPELFGRFDENLATGARMWWHDTSPEWIAAVAGTGRPFYTRLVPAGLEQEVGS